MPTDINFDANEVPPSSPFEPVPAGWYKAHIVESEVKPTKNGAGRYLQLTYEILEGDYAGRKFWDRLNIVNANETAKEIAQRALSAICHAVGVLKLTNSAQLHNIPLLAKLTVRQDVGYEPGNDVKGYKAVEGGTGVAVPKHGSTAQGAAQAAALAPRAANPAPWAKPPQAAPQAKSA